MMRRLAAAMLAVLWLAAAPAPAADLLPGFAHTSVNDFAGVLDQDAVRRLDEALIALERETGVQGTVVTLPDRKRYGDPGLEAFSRRLFDAWGVGRAWTGDGFMVLAIPPAREVRIELGSAYGRAWDAEAARIVDKVMLPALRAGRLSDGLRDGVLAVADRIARPRAAGAGVPRGDAFARPPGGGLAGLLLPTAVFGVFAVVGAGMLRTGLRRRRGARCPACGAAVVTGSEPTGTVLPGGIPTGGRRVTRRCPACGWSDSRVAAAPITPAGSMFRGERGLRDRGGGGGRGGFGGGRSGGGGASGRW